MTKADFSNFLAIRALLEDEFDTLPHIEITLTVEQWAQFSDGRYAGLTQQVGMSDKVCLIAGGLIVREYGAPR